MKTKFILYFSSLILVLFLLPSCTSQLPAPTTEAKIKKEEKINEIPLIVPKEITFEEKEPTFLTKEQLSDFPIATENMTAEEKRRLCVEFFQLQLSFLWKTDLDINDYQATYYDFGEEGKALLTENLYGGIAYQSGGTGNLYRFLEYYNEGSGTFEISRAFGENGGYGDGAALLNVEADQNGNITYKQYRAMRLFFNHCSSSPAWAWGRVINSARMNACNESTVLNGYIPVGLYFVPGMMDQSRYRSDLYGTKDIVEQLKKLNGPNAMATYYAQMRSADCLVKSGEVAGHMLMVKSVHVEKTKSGVIDSEKSTVTVLEQIENWGEKSQMEGTSFYRQGGVDRVYSFQQLQNSSYLPFTFAELLDENDEADRAHLEFYEKYAHRMNPLAKSYKSLSFSSEEISSFAGTGVEKAVAFSSVKTETVSAKEFKNLVVGSNYAISDVFVRIFDPKEILVLENIYRATSTSCREVDMNAEKSSYEKDANGNFISISHGIGDYANQGHRVEVSLQISTGEKLVAYSGILTP